MTERTRKSLFTVALLALATTFVIMSLTIIGFIGRAHAAGVVDLPDSPTSFFAQLYVFIKNGEHLPAVGAGLMLFTWFLRWAHEKLPAPVGPFFQTKLGGYVLGFGTALNVYLGTALIAHQPWTFGLFLQAIGTGFAASGKWEGLMDVLKKPPGVSSRLAKSTTAVLLTALLISPVLTGCDWTKHEVKHAGDVTLDCTKGELANLENLAPTLLPLLVGEKPDWKVISAQLEQAGVNVGTCVLASLIDRYTSNLKLATPEGTTEANQVFNDLKSKYHLTAVKTSVGTR